MDDKGGKTIFRLQKKVYIIKLKYKDRLSIIKNN